MSKAEKFISDCTRKCSNLMQVPTLDDKGNIVPEAHPWLTPEEERKAVEIAREEIYDWLTNHYRDYMHNPTGKKLEAFFGMDMITDLKQAMQDE